MNLNFIILAIAILSSKSLADNETLNHRISSIIVISLILIISPLRF